MPSGKPVKADAELLRILRATLIRKLDPRLRPILRGDAEKGLAVTGFSDPDFVETFGVGFDKVPDRALVDQALIAAIRMVESAPDGTCGFDFFDQPAR